MLVPLRWLNEILPSGLEIDRLLDVLTMSGLEVEDTIDLGMKSGKIVVGRVLETQAHPNADRLTLVKVDAGGEAPLDIVCGATNLYPGMLVPCALPGAVLPEGMEIRKSKIRGEKSEGMLCSGRELNFGTDHSGILELPDTYQVGEPFDFIVDIKVTPNRADCLSMYGVARDVAAMIGKKVFPETHRVSEMLEHIDEFAKVIVRARRGCPRYSCRYVKDVRVGESPLWLKRRLESCGMRPINNVVDITNYVMHEFGIPLHAFDFDRIHGGTVIVRYANEGEKFVALDDRELTLTAEDLVIADEDRPIALAGVMGGKNTEVTDATSHVLIECAFFDPVTVRRGARRHNIQSESSYRFERGTDIGRVPVSLNRATQLMHELTEGEVARGAIDEQGPRTEETLIHLDIGKANGYLGLELTNAEIADRLVNLGFEIRRSDRETLSVARPTSRLDVELDVDLIEEIARIVGYDNIPETMPAIRSSPEPVVVDGHRDLRRVRDVLVELGYCEAIHMTFTSEAVLRRHGWEASKQPALANPMTIDQKYLRPALLPDLVRAYQYNQRQGAAFVNLFEVGKIYGPGARAGHAEDERLSLALALGGTRPFNWSAGPRDCDFFDLKGGLESLGERLGLPALQFEPGAPEDVYHPGRSAKVSAGGETLGFMGELHPELAKAEEIRGRAYCAELDLDALLKLAKASRPTFREIPRLPGSERDLAVVVDEAIPASELLEAARAAGKETIESLNLLDVYRGEHVEAGKKSLALRLTLRSTDATLTDEQINDVMGRVLKRLQKDCGAELRS